jgi:hypothetical protein
MDVESEPKHINGESDLEAGITKPFGRVLSAELRQVGCVEVAVQEQRNPASNDNA